MTVGHGLSKAPNITIVKDRSNDGSNWILFYDVDDGSLDYMYPNAYTGGANSSLTGPNSTIWNFDGSNNMYNTSVEITMYAYNNGYQLSAPTMVIIVMIMGLLSSQGFVLE